MSAAERSAGPLRLLEWDTRFFERRVASLAELPAGSLPDALPDALRSAREQGVECIYLLSEADDLPALRAAERAGARLVDVRLTFERALDGVDPRAAPPGIRASREADVPALRALAAQSHDASRFYADGRFPRPLCDELFATWIEKSCRGWADFVLVGESGGAPSGYITGHARDGGRGEIGLVAVAASAQGAGLGKQLVDAALSAFRARDLARVTVVTQARNVGAQRIYQSRGFRTARVQLWHHLWLDEGRAGA